MCFFAKEQALLNISPTSIPTLNIKNVEPSNAEDAVVAAIHPIITSTFPMRRDSGRRQMDQPPEEQEENQQQTIDPIQRSHLALFPIPSSAFAILKRGFHTPP